MAGNNIKSIFAEGIKAASGIFSRTPASSGIVNVGFMGNGTGSASPFSLSPGSSINWALVTGPIESNPVASACLAIIQDNVTQARAGIEQKTGAQDDYAPLEEHVMLPILAQPNPLYSWSYLLKGIVASMHGQGNAYIGIERDGTGTPAALYWLPYGVRPKNGRTAADGWLYRSDANEQKEVFVKQADIIHIPMGTNPSMPGFGLAVWDNLKQDQYSLQQGGNYTANIFRNNGTLGALFSPKQIRNTDGQMMQAQVDPQKVVDMWRAKTRGDRAGDAMAFDAPMDVAFPENSPQKLAIDTILDRPEHNICARFRVPIIMVGAYGGRHSKTYANWEQAVSSFWEECALPLLGVIAAEFTRQLLPQMGGDAVNERMAFDTSEIRALQPDLDKLHERARRDWEANGIDLHTYCTETKRVAEDWMKGIYRWMLPTIADRAVSGDSLMPPEGMAEERSIPSSGNGTGTQPKPMAVSGAFPAMAGKSAIPLAERLRRRMLMNGKH